MTAAKSAATAAAVACPDRIEPLLDAVSLARTTGDVEGEGRHLAALLERLTDTEQPLQLAALERTVVDPLLGREVLEAMRLRLAAAAASSTDPSLWRALAVAASRLDRHAEARDALDRVLATAPSPEVRWACVDLDRTLERWQSMAGQLEALVAEDEVKATLARVQLVEAYARLGRVEDALAAARLVATEVSPEAESLAGARWAADALLEAAWILHDNEREEQARRAFQGVLALDGSRTEVAEALALLYGPVSARQARAEEAERRLEEEGDSEAWLAEGTERLAVGDAAAAIEPLRRAAAGLGNHEIAWYNLGLAAVRLERWSEAVEALERALALAPANPVTRLNLGVALVHDGRCDRALEVLDSLVSDRPDQWQAHYWRWSCLRNAGDAEAAAAALTAYEAGRGAAR